MIQARCRCQTGPRRGRAAIVMFALAILGLVAAAVGPATAAEARARSAAEVQAHLIAALATAQAAEDIVGRIDRAAQAAADPADRADRAAQIRSLAAQLDSLTADLAAGGAPNLLGRGARPWRVTVAGKPLEVPAADLSARSLGFDRTALPDRAAVAAVQAKIAPAQARIARQREAIAAIARGLGPMPDRPVAAVADPRESGARRLIDLALRRTPP